ncbi:hypothetical protein IAD21_01008 [Abditibacteriota bacterium]|nr:hypothetical protein IAD21_01008 [Abditibacteriota bacterium]
MDLHTHVPSQVLTIDSFFSPNECRAQIERAEQGGFEAAPLTTAFGPVVRSDVRNNARWMSDDPELAAQLWQRLEPFVPSPLNGIRALGLNERLRYYRYERGQTFRPHYDGSFRRANGEESQFTFMIYLNDGFTGGQTRFDLRYPHDELIIEPREGMAILFLHSLFHEGSTVFSGQKYVLRSDVMFERLLT